MPQVVNIQGIGRVNFPDGMSAEQIQSAIERDILPQRSHPYQSDEAYARSQADALKPPEVEGPGVMARVGRGMLDVGQGLNQKWLQLNEALGNKGDESPIFNPATGKYGAQRPKAETAEEQRTRVNDELATYDRGRAAQGGGFDAARLAGNAVATLPLAAAGPAGTTMLARVGAGAVQGALAGGAQFTPSGKLADTAINTAVGAGVGAVAAPLVGWTGDKALQLGQKMVGWWRGVKANEATVDDLLRAIPELADAPPAAQRDLIAEAQQQIRTTGTLNAEQLGRKANLIAQGLTPTKSMVTREGADWTLERNLQKLAQSPDESLSRTGRDLTDIYQRNDRTLTSRLQSMTGGLPQRTQEAHGTAVMQALDDLSGASQRDVSAVYNQVRAARGDQLASDARQLVSTLDDLRDSTYAEKMVGSVMNKLRRFGMLDQEGNLTNNTLTVTQSEELRKFVNALPNDYGKQQIIRAIDSDVLSGLGDDAFAGARGAAASRFAMLDNPSTQRALNTFGELQQGKTAQNFIQSQIINGADQDVAALVQTIQRMPGQQAQATMNELRAGVLQHLQDAAVEPRTGKFSGAMLDRAVRDIGEDKLIRILGVDQYRQLQNLARAAVDATSEPAYSAVNHSNTGATILSLMQSRGGQVAQMLPGIGPLAAKPLAQGAERWAAESQLREALAARAAGQLPQIPQSARNMVQALATVSPPAANAALNQRRKPPNRQAQNGK